MPLARTDRASLNEEVLAEIMQVSGLGCLQCATRNHGARRPMSKLDRSHPLIGG